MIVFGSQLWKRPDDWIPPVMHHDDPDVMAIAKVLADTDPDGMGKWEYLVDGAGQMDGSQTGDYYGEPYARKIEQYITQAVAIKEALT